jgi:hypothetical protein
LSRDSPGFVQLVSGIRPAFVRVDPGWLWADDWTCRSAAAAACARNAVASAGGGATARSGLDGFYGHSRLQRMMGKERSAEGPGLGCFYGEFEAERINSKGWMLNRQTAKVGSESNCAQSLLSIHSAGSGPN